MTSDDPDPLLPAERSGTRPLVWALSMILFVAFSGLGLWLAARVTGGGVPRLDPRLFEPSALALIGGVLEVYYLSDGLRLYHVLRALDVTLRFGKLMPLVFINILFSNVTPLASGGGFALVRGDPPRNRRLLARVPAVSGRTMASFAGGYPVDLDLPADAVFLSRPSDGAA